LPSRWLRELKLRLFGVRPSDSTLKVKNNVSIRKLMESYENELLIGLGSESENLK
jgi:hypothetical protein